MNRGRPGTPALLAGLLSWALVTVTIGGAYLLVELAADRLAGHAVAAAAATAVAAVLALPAYGGARRITGGRAGEDRPAGYQVLAQLAALPRPPTRDVPDLARVVEAVGLGLGADECSLTVRRPGLRDRVHTWTRPGAEPGETRWEVPVRHGAEDVGTLAVDRVTVAGSTAERRQLLEAVASSLGVALQATRAGIELERQLRAALAHATDIAAARRRAVAESDGERRRIERDLHDGAQHHLVSLSLGLGLVEHELATGRLEQARTGLHQITARIATVEELLTRTSTGVRSPVLAEAGLVAALEEDLGADDPPVTLDAPRGLRFPPEVDAAVYFCCLEAVNNARKHAPGAAVSVRLWVDRDRLRFAVRDDGPGWDPSAGAPSQGRGMRNLAARVAAVGGQVDVRSAPGAGTTVEGSVSLPGPPAAAPPSVEPAAPGLLGDVRTAVRTAQEVHSGTVLARRLESLARALDEPLRIVVSGPPGAPVAALAEALAATAPPGVRYSPAAAPEDHPRDPAPDAAVLVFGDAGPGDDDRPAWLPATARPAHTIGVQLGDGPPPAAARACQTVVAVRPAGPPAGALLDDDGLSRVRNAVDSRLVARAEALKARTVLSALETILRGVPSGPLVYQLEAIRSGAHELVELDLVDALCSGEIRVPDDQRRIAERLLGVDGVPAAARLGCGPDARPGELADAAATELARWQRAAAHPTSTAASRRLAEFLVRTCERLLSAVTAPGEPSSGGCPHPGAGAGPDRS
ncbi:sensor histidine kinase [Geodermatophilus sp. CPCC 206100]|uniref:sensor histidine kinase n=1 Tax=Geodermatophilus sp. CPCC 206100 TaxID=3020054 RepID=UPI003B00B2CC